MSDAQYVLQVYPDAITYSYESQVVQYPRLGAPGIEYFAGDGGFAKPVDCLLWRDDEGLVRGILNHYPVDMPPHEKAGNINLFIDPARQRQGIGTALVREANRRWGPINWNQQRYTKAGIELAYKLITELGGPGVVFDVVDTREGTHRYGGSRRRKKQ